MSDELFPKFSGPTKTWLDLCRRVLDNFDREYCQSELDDVKRSAYIQEHFKN